MLKTQEGVVDAEFLVFSQDYEGKVNIVARAFGIGQPSVHTTVP